MIVIEIFYYLIIKRRETYPKKAIEECSLTHQEESSIVEGKNDKWKQQHLLSSCCRRHLPYNCGHVPKKGGTEQVAH